MMLQSSEFPSKSLAVCYWICCKVCYVWAWSVNQLLSNFISTSDELKERMEETCLVVVIVKLVKILLCLAVIIAWLPFALIAFILKIVLQKYRCPYAYHYRENQYEKNPYVGLYLDIEDGHSAPFFHVTSFNTCLLPEALSRINNLRKVEKRAQVIAAYIVNSQVRPNPRIFVQSPTATDLKILSVCSTDDQFCSLPRNQSQITYSTDDYDDVFVAQVSYPSCSRIQRDRILSDSATLVKSRYAQDSTVSTDVVAAAAGYSQLSRINEGLSFSSVDMRKSSAGGYRSSSNNRHNVVHAPLIEQNRPRKPQPSSTSTNAFFDSNPSVCLRECGVAVSEPVSTIPPGSTPLFFSFDNSHLHDMSHEIITDFEHSLSINFPPEMDFLCLQEVFDACASRNLVRGLQVWFSHVLTDAGVCSWSANKFMLSSGLLIASRYPIIDAEFRNFTGKEKEDKAICKGLLMAKVHVGTTNDGHRLVGYISTTQLQSTQDHETRSIQMTEIMSWLESFRSSTTEDERIVIDVLTGNFNFDNMSPKDVSDFSHPLFSVYQDPCRQMPGLDHSWTVGTVLKSSTLHDKDVSTPEGLQRILEDVQLRGKYVEDLEVFLTSASGSIPSNMKDCQRYKGNGRRRVDLILYNNDNAHYQQMCEEFHFITQLTSLTDHIPLSMVLSSGGTQRPATWSQPDSRLDGEARHSKDELVFYESSIDLDVVVSDAGSSHDSWT